MLASDVSPTPPARRRPFRRGDLLQLRERRARHGGAGARAAALVAHRSAAAARRRPRRHAAGGRGGPAARRPGRAGTTVRPEPRARPATAVRPEPPARPVTRRRLGTVGSGRDTRSGRNVRARPATAGSSRPEPPVRPATGARAARSTAHRAGGNGGGGGEAGGGCQIGGRRAPRRWRCCSRSSCSDDAVGDLDLDVPGLREPVEQIRFVSVQGAFAGAFQHRPEDDLARFLAADAAQESRNDASSSKRFSNASSVR